MKKRRILDIAMRSRDRRGYHGKKIKVIMVECHEAMRKVVYHGNEKEAVVKKYHEEVTKILCHGKGNVWNKIMYHEK